MNIYIFRHAETYFSKNQIAYRDQIESADILPEGIPAIERLAKYLNDIKTEVNFTSPYKRCQQTSKIVSDITSKKFETDDDLRDWDPRKERTEEMIKRILKFSRNLQSTNLKSALICTHGYPINALIAYFTKGFIREADLPNFPNPGVLVSIIDGKVAFKDFNKNLDTNI